MFNTWVQKLAGQSEVPTESSSEMHQISTQLLLEVARADTDISNDELDIITRTLVARSKLSEDEVDELMTSSAEEVESSISFHSHVRAINENFDKAMKIELMTQMWEVAYADNHLDEYEEGFIRQISELIHVKHRDFIQTKLRVIDQNSD